MTTQTAQGFTRERGEQIMHLLSTRFGSADLESNIDGTFSVRTAFWSPDDARSHRHSNYGYCGTETTVSDDVQAFEVLHREDLLTIDEASNLRSRLGL